MSFSSADDVLQRQLDERQQEIALLQARVVSLSQQLQHALEQKNQRVVTDSSSISSNNNDNNNTTTTTKQRSRRAVPLSPFAITVGDTSTRSTSSAPHNSRNGSSHYHKGNVVTTTRQHTRLGRNASVTTQQILQTLSQEQYNNPDGTGVPHDPPVIQRILDMFQQPSIHMDYLNSHQFAKDLVKLAFKMCQVLEKEPRVVFVQSPCYVFGDIHGNLEDLHFFSDNVWRLGMSLTAGNFVFLGDYVDRGCHCLECVAYLLAVKYQLPNKVFLLRGNHETRDVNGWEEHYAERSFIYQCRSRFGDDVGYKVWEACNQLFDRMPLAAVIDQDIFCVHGGIPRPISPNTTRIQDILTVPRVAGINPPYQHEDDNYQQVASDCIWSDPASSDQEATTVDPETGFGESLRGGGAICFGNKAVTDFLQQHDLSYIMRAHEAHAEGVAISKGARVFTVFSTSQDHNQGQHAMAGCILVDNEKMQVINRSPAYKNQYVHRRDSVSLACLTDSEVQKRLRLGLIKDNMSGELSDKEDEEDEEVEEWEDLTDMDEEAVHGRVSNDSADATAARREKDDYVLQTSRRSSIDLSSLTGMHHDVLDASIDGGEDSMSGLAVSTEDDRNKRHCSKYPSVASIREDALLVADETMDCPDDEDEEDLK